MRSNWSAHASRENSCSASRRVEALSFAWTEESLTTSTTHLAASSIASWSGGNTAHWAPRSSFEARFSAGIRPITGRPAHR